MNTAFNKYFGGLTNEYNLLLIIGLNDNENDKKYFKILEILFW